ncbi:MAG: hypothetical protein WD595_06050 [Waddliaceae bacterium]
MTRIEGAADLTGIDYIDPLDPKKNHFLTSLVQKVLTCVQKIWNWIKSLFCEKPMPEYIQNAIAKRIKYNRPDYRNEETDSDDEIKVDENVPCGPPVVDPEKTRYMSACVSLIDSYDEALLGYQFSNAERKHESDNVLRKNPQFIESKKALIMGFERLYDLLVQTKVPDVLSEIINPLQLRARHDSGEKFKNLAEDSERIAKLFFPNDEAKWIVKAIIPHIIPKIRSIIYSGPLEQNMDRIFLTSAEAFATKLQEHLYISNIDTFSQNAIQLYRLDEEQKVLNHYKEDVENFESKLKFQISSNFMNGKESLIGYLKKIIDDYFEGKGLVVSELKEIVSDLIQEKYDAGAESIISNLNIGSFAQNCTENINERINRLIDSQRDLHEEMVNKLVSLFQKNAPNYWKGDLVAKRKLISDNLKKDLEIDFKVIHKKKSEIKLPNNFAKYRKEHIKEVKRQELEDTLALKEQNNQNRAHQQIAELAIDYLNNTEFGNWGSRLLRFDTLKSKVVTALEDNILYSTKKMYPDGSFAVKSITDLFNQLIKDKDIEDEVKVEESAVNATDELSNVAIDYLMNTVDAPVPTFALRRVLGTPEQLSRALRQIQKKLLGIGEDDKEVQKRAISANEALFARIQDVFLGVLERTASSNDFRPRPFDANPILS